MTSALPKPLASVKDSCRAESIGQTTKTERITSAGARNAAAARPRLLPGRRGRWVVSVAGGRLGASEGLLALSRRRPPIAAGALKARGVGLLAGDVYMAVLLQAGAAPCGTGQPLGGTAVGDYWSSSADWISVCAAASSSSIGS